MSPDFRLPIRNRVGGEAAADRSNQETTLGYCFRRLRPRGRRRCQSDSLAAGKTLLDTWLTAQASLYRKESIVEYRRVGRWGVRVSTVGLGSWLTYGGNVDADSARRCVQRAYELGVSFFDTANAYSAGEGERLLGNALSGYPRESYVLATKVFFPVGKSPNSRGLSRKHIFEEIHHSLRRLRVEYIDIYQCHRFDPETPLDETCRIMNDLVTSGKILYWGVSEWNLNQIRQAMDICHSEGWSLPISNQPQYSLLWREIESELLPASAGLGMGNFAWSPLAFGILTGKYTNVNDVPDGSRGSPENARVMSSSYPITWSFWERMFRQSVLDSVGRLRRIAEDAGCTTAQLALRWCLRRPEISSVIVGVTKVAHVEDNVVAGQLTLGPDVLDAIDAVLGDLAHE